MITPTFDLVFEAGKIALRTGQPNDHHELPQLVDLDRHEIPDVWLNEANRRYRRASLPPKRRPFEALLDYTREKNGAISFRSRAATRVFNWFKERSAPEAHYLGPLFTGSYFYDGYFWPVTIGIGWGQFKLDALDALQTMPQPLKQELVKDDQELRVYLLYFADCVDYAYGLDDILRSKTLPPRALLFLTNADKELRGAIAQTNGAQPNPRAALSARMAMEIFLKTLLVANRDASDSESRKLGHDLIRICQVVQQSGTGAHEIETIKGLVHTLPPVSDRYTGEDVDLRSVGNALSLCQMCATTVIRQFTDRDIRPQLFVRQSPRSQ
jgi:hypothetical protein